jgi:hypothetical protein
VTDPAAKREVIGVVFRGIRAELDRRGLTERVLARLQGEAREALERPPLHSTWLPGRLHDEILVATAHETNRQMLRDIGYSVSKATTGPIALPLIKTVLSLFGASPASLLNNLDRITSIQVRGVHHVYQPETPTSGVVTISYPDPADPLLFAVWEGVFSFSKDILGIPVTVETAVSTPDGRSARVRVVW